MRGAFAGVLISLNLLLGGCAGNRATNVIPEYRLLPGDKFIPQVAVAGNVEEGGVAILKRRLATGLREYGLLGRAGDPNSRMLEVTVTNLSLRNDVLRSAVGIFAGTDNIQSTTEVLDPSTRNVAWRFNVETNNPSAWGTSQGLIETHADMIVRVINRAMPKGGQAAAVRPGSERPPKVAAPPAVAAAVAPTIVATAPSSSSIKAAPAAEGMPARGARWRYGYRDHIYHAAERFFTIEVLSVEGLRVQERLMVDGGDITQGHFDADDLRFVARPVSSGAAVLELAPYSPALYKRAAATPRGYPATPGTMWDIGTTSYAEDSVTVPAGSFSVLRVEVSGSVNNFGATTTTFAQSARFTYTAWYSQDLKRYVKVRHQTWSRGGQRIGDEVTQLMSYQPGN